MRIKQGYVSNGVKNFKNRWFKMFDLVDYHNDIEPAVFFYNIPTDLEIILNELKKT